MPLLIIEEDLSKIEEMKEVFLVKTRTGFMPAYAADSEIIGKIPAGEMVKAKITRDRNIGFHRKFFALLNIAYENLPEQYNMSFENFREEIIKKAGYYESYINFAGKEVYRAKSISFANMDQGEFEELYSKVLDVILSILKVSEKEMEQFLNFM